MSALSNARAAQRRIKIPNPLKAADKIWDAAAGPTQWPKNPPLNPPTPVTYLAGTPRPRKRGAAGYSKGGGPD
jgi:hypothetical protein